MEKKEFVIGVLGGMGTYATIHLFEQYAELFAAEKEWERPRIIIDNHCTMPSRVRAILYAEKKDILVRQMTDSIQSLISAGARRIILGCNTSHVFLKEIYKNFPEAKEYIVSIIDVCVSELKRDNIKKVYLLATEGTIISGVYNKCLEKEGITCLTPTEEEFPKIRLCIEAVKQKKYTNEIKKIFAEFMSKNEVCILGCTELPILYQKYQNDLKKGIIYDPLYLTLNKIKEEYEHLTG